jgi:hypothetical protein
MFSPKQGLKQVFQYFTNRILAQTVSSYASQWTGRAGNTADFEIGNERNYKIMTK